MSNHNKYTLQAGTVIEDKWIILEFLGKGGMGEVYRAHQLNLKRDIAFKIISKEWMDSMEENEEEIGIGLQRFRNEVLSMAQVRHPNLLQIYDYGSFSFPPDNPYDIKLEYIVMEYIPGGTLRSTMSEDGFYPEESLVEEWVVRYLFPVLDGVQALHTAGIIHRDLKPGNILMDGSTPRITDFGLARSSSIGPVTISMDIKGTPAYMSPEHFMDLKRSDHRSDIYSLGKILYEAIDGKIGPNTIPFKSASLHKVKSPFFEKFDEIIRTATAENRDQRYSSVEDFRTAVQKALMIEEKGEITSEPVQNGMFQLFFKPMWIWGGIALAVILVTTMTLWHLLGQPGGLARMPDESSPSLSETDSTGPLGSTAATNALMSPSLVTGKDGAKLHLIPEGELLLPVDTVKAPGKPVKIEPFYMDETEVTNHQYAEFLNKVISKIRVEKEVIEAEGEVWLLLGEVTKGYEPIIFKDGKFVVQDPIYHSHPIVRVTALGAAAYAEYNGRRLPTAAEWLYASGTKNNPILEASPTRLGEPVDSHREMMYGQGQIPPPVLDQGFSESPVSVTESLPNEYGIRGLNGNVDEWGIIAPELYQISKGSKYGILPGAVVRLPWEAFKDVGFRTVLPVSK